MNVLGNGDGNSLRIGVDPAAEGADQTTIVKLHLPCYLTGFMLDIEKMNGMYELDTIQETGFNLRLDQFRDILKEECKEIDDIRELAQGVIYEARSLEIRTQLADLLGDIIVYCASEALRWNIPIDRVLHIIQQSNFSKLGLDGKPIKDERGKFLKGPNYWKPEPKIAELLKEHNA